MLYTKEIAEILEKQLAEVDAQAIEEWGTFQVVASDETKDRDGDIITLDGWEIENYLKNPVILANHTYSIENIIGKTTKIYAKDNKIIVEGIFSKSNPLGILAQRLYEEGMLKTVSVWFIGKEREGEKITKKELLELSFVAVPANPSAVSLDWKLYQEAVEKGLIKEIEEAKTIDLTQFYDVIWELNKELMKNIETLSLELKEVKDTIETLADDKAEEKASEKARKEAQNLAKALSSYLEEAKK